MVNQDTLQPFIPTYFQSSSGRGWLHVSSGADAIESAYQSYLLSKQDTFTIENETLSFSKCELEGEGYGWEYKDDGKWKYFPDKATQVLETAYNNKESECCVPLQFDDEELFLRVSIQKMLMYISRRHTQELRRSIIRKKLFRLSYGWYWQGDQTWTPYPPQDTITLENAYIRNQISCDLDLKTINNQVDRYVIKFTTMKQYLLGNENVIQRQVQRVGPRVNRECLFSVPSTWQLYQDGLNEVLPSNPIFSEISNYLNKTIIHNHSTVYGHVPGTHHPPQRFKIIKLCYLKNVNLWTEYQNSKQKLFPISADFQKVQKASPLLLPLLDTKTTEAYLFHGSSHEVIDKILIHGFLTRFTYEIVSGSVYDGMFGHGVYFAEQSSKSNQYVPCPLCGYNCISKKGPCNCSKEDIRAAGGYCMVLARVLLGNPHVCKTYSKEKYKDLTMAISGTNSIWAERSDHLKYREFVVYDSPQMYPEFIIYYERE
eukprot:TRINITY_DN16290_c0_g2_i1.p1 TRINITY_DN16290_c0_g2~~TRINITY_DN16290_c0_g2_i1.p1  ORF type:complete len:514 (-),score=124.84 TRINITY_DN16290_c0_g2_i1:105-1559(-)